MSPMQKPLWSNLITSYAENGLEIHEEDNNCRTILALTR